MAESVGERLIRVAHDELQMNQSQLATAIGVSAETLRKWKTGEIAPNRTRARKIADLFGRSVSWVMHGDAADENDSILPLRVHWHEPELIAGYRLLDERDRTDLLAHVRELVMLKHGPTFRALERLNLLRRADDEKVAAHLPAAPPRSAQKRTTSR